MESSELMIAVEVDVGPSSPEATVNGSKRVTLRSACTVMFGKDAAAQ
jgi:hypothetical protein